MISTLTGLIADISSNKIIIDVSGVGYGVTCSTGCVEQLKVGGKTTLIVYTDVREDAIILYGFKDKLEREIFLLLKTVKGVGSKSAIDLLSQVKTFDLLRAIGSGDISGLQSLKGVGKKTSERIIVELKEKVGAFALEQAEGFKIDVVRTTPYQDAEAALMALGFSQSIANRALGQVQIEIKGSGNTSELVKEALKYV